MFKKITKIQNSLKRKIKTICLKTNDGCKKILKKVASTFKVIFRKVKKINFSKFVHLIVDFVLKSKQRTVAYISIFAIFIGTFIVIPTTYVSALQVKYNDETVGFVANQKTATKATAQVINQTECEDGFIEEVLEDGLSVKKTIAASSSLIEKKELSEKIVEAIEELEAGYGIYLGKDLYCSFKNQKELELFKKELAKRISEKYNTNDYTISGLSYSEGNFLKNTIKSYNKEIVSDVLDSIVVEHYVYKEKEDKLSFDTVYIADKNLSLGENVIASKGKKGKVKYTYKIIYSNGKRQKRVLYKTDIIKEPKSKMIKVSEEEYNILSANNLIKKQNFAFPLRTNDYYVSSLYGYRWGKIHNGIDLACESGVGIRAYKKGTVVVAESESGYGNYIIVEHKNGLKTLYAHCSALLADVGSKVKKGQVIALAGSTGRSTGSHLHFEVILNEQKVNPAKYLGLYVEDNKDSEKINTIPQPISLTGEKLEFVESIKTAAIEAYQHYNILPSLTISQAIIESAWGKSAIGNNIFGIKAFSDWKGKKQYVWTSEENADGTKYRCQAWFKDYDSVLDSVRDHSKLLLNSRYDAVRQATNYREACYAVKAAGYATSSDYAETLINVIETYGLYAWDDVNYKIDGEIVISSSDPEKETSTKIEKVKEKSKKKTDKNKKKQKKEKKTNKTTTKATTILTTAVVTTQKTTTTTISPTVDIEEPVPTTIGVE